MAKTEIGNVSNLALGVGLVAVGFVAYQLIRRGDKVAQALTPALEGARSSLGFIAGTNDERTLGTAIFDAVEGTKETFVGLVSGSNDLWPSYWNREQADKTRDALAKLRGYEIPPDYT